MIILLRIIFCAILAMMLLATTWASMQCALWRTPHEVVSHPWFIATLFDTYFGFLTFWLWVAYKERNWGTRLAWLIAIFLLGNIAMSIYMLRLLFQLPTTASIERVLLRDES